MLTDDGRPVCGSCGATPPKRNAIVDVPLSDADGRLILPPYGLRPYTAAEHEQACRAGGWRIGELPGRVHDAMCPSCAKPAKDLVRLCRELPQSTLDGEQP